MEKYHGNTVEYWKKNAEENYLTTPISVLKYITVLEALTEQLRKHAVITSVCASCKDVTGFYLGTTCPKCNRPFRAIKQTDL